MEDWVQWAQFQAQAHAVATMVTILISVVSALIVMWWHHPLYGKNVGPKVYPIIGSLPALLKNSNRMFDYLHEEIRKTPTHTIRFVRPGVGGVYDTANVENVEHILKTRFENYYKGGFLGDMLGDVLGKGIFNVDGDLWKLQRKLASHEFTSRSLREFGFECTERELEERLLPFLFNACENCHSVDLQDVFLRFSFDNICQLGFGVDPKCLDLSLPSVPFATAFDKAVQCTLMRFSMLPISLKVRRMFKLGTERELRESMAVVNEFADEVIQARRKEFQGEGDHSLRQDLLSRFMRFTDAANHDAVVQSELEQKCMRDLNLTSSGPESKDVFLRDIVISFVLAGRDTSSTGLTWFFHALSQNPHVEAKIYDEIKQHVESQGRETSRHLFSFEELKKLQYLHAAIHESLRLFPPVPMDTKEAVRDDVLPDGTVIRKGERITYNIYAMGRMQAIWGEDCEEFKPERWLKDGVFVPENPFKFAAFQAGPRICLGKELALMQMKLVASSLIYHFRFSATEKRTPPMVLLSLVLRMTDGFPVLVQSRSHSP